MDPENHFLGRTSPPRKPYVSETPSPTQIDSQPSSLMPKPEYGDCTSSAWMKDCGLALKLEEDIAFFQDVTNSSTKWHHKPSPLPLDKRDPRQYPLAATPAPRSLKSFSRSSSYKSEALDTQDDSTESSEYSMERRLESYFHPISLDPSLKQSKRPISQCSRKQGFSRKRILGAEPPCLQEAAELASLHRRSKRQRFTIGSEKAASSIFEEHSVAAISQDKEWDVSTCSNEVEACEQHRPKDHKCNRRRRLKAMAKLARFKTDRSSGPSSTNDHLGADLNLGEAGTPNSEISRTISEVTALDSTSQNGPTPGPAATPPIADSDLEPDGMFDDSTGKESTSPLPALDTRSVQDASLPSPLLSPVTVNDDDENSFELDDPTEAENIGAERFCGGNMDDTMALIRAKLESAGAVKSGNPQLPTPSAPLMDIPVMIDSFDCMSEELQKYVLYRLLQRCNKSNLHFVANVVNPALKCDFLRLLPAELSINVIRFMDVKTMCAAAQVSKTWRCLIDTDDRAWKARLENDGFSIPPAEIARAKRELWGWQGVLEYETNARDYLSDSDSSTEDAVIEKMMAGRSSAKRRMSPKTIPGAKRRKTNNHRALDAQSTPMPASTLGNHIGLKSLCINRMYKVLYRRHHAIHKRWMEQRMEPYHFAFRAHGRHVVTCLQFDSDKILTGSDDTKIHVYDTHTGARRRMLHGHDGGVWALQYDGNTLVSGSTDRTVRVWDIESGECLHVFQGHTSTVRCLVILKPTKIGERADGTAIMMPEQPLIITGSRDSTLRIWKLPQPGAPRVVQTNGMVNGEYNPYFVRTLCGHVHSVRAIAAHGDTLVSGSYDSTVRVWKISTGETVHRLTGHSQRVYSVILDHERNRCISGSMDTFVKVWSLETGSCILNLEGHGSLVGLLDLSYGRLVSAAADSTLRIWDPETGHCKSILSAHTGAITCFQHDGQKVISGSDRTLKIWDIKTGECTRDLLTNLTGVWQVKFNQRMCVAAVQRERRTYVEVLDFGAFRDGVPEEVRGTRIVVNRHGQAAPESADTDDDEHEEEGH